MPETGNKPSVPCFSVVSQPHLKKPVLHELPSFRLPGFFVYPDSFLV